MISTEGNPNEAIRARLREIFPETAQREIEAQASGDWEKMIECVRSGHLLSVTKTGPLEWKIILTPKEER